MLHFFTNEGYQTAMCNLCKSHNAFDGVVKVWESSKSLEGGYGVVWCGVVWVGTVGESRMVRNMRKFKLLGKNG